MNLTMIESVMASESYVLAKKMLDAAALRHELLATNLANIATPGFKRSDLDPGFSGKLESLIQKGDMEAVRSFEIRSLQDATAKSSRSDGNNVELDRELLEMNRNALEYDFLAQYTSDSIKRLKTAITGRVS